MADWHRVAHRASSLSDEEGVELEARVATDTTLSRYDDDVSPSS